MSLVENIPKNCEREKKREDCIMVEMKALAERFFLFSYWKEEWRVEVVRYCEKKSLNILRKKVTIFK